MSVAGQKGANEMWLWTGSEYRNVDIENAEWVKPALNGNRCDIFVKYPDRKEPELYTGAQASGVLEYVLKRLVTSNPSDAMGRIFQQVEAEKDLSQKNGNGRKTRRKRVLRDPVESKRRMSEAAFRRWAREREAQQETPVGA